MEDLPPGMRKICLDNEGDEYPGNGIPSICYDTYESQVDSDSRIPATKHKGKLMLMWNKHHILPVTNYDYDKIVLRKSSKDYRHPFHGFIAPKVVENIDFPLNYTGSVAEPSHRKFPVKTMNGSGKMRPSWKYYHHPRQIGIAEHHHRGQNRR